MKNSPPPTAKAYGLFISHGIKLESHEIDTINFFVNLGEIVEQIPPSNTKYTSRPDIFMRSLVWEMKSPTNNTTNALSRLFYRAIRQSPNVIFDLRRLKSKNAITLLQKLFHSSRHAKNLLIITQKSEIIEFHKNS